MRDPATFWLPDRQGYAIAQERDRHTEALYAYGEYTMVLLMWRIEDHEAGLVQRCSTCYLPYGKVTDTYKQASRAFCPNCFGTTFEGGYRARIIRPVLWDDTKDSHSTAARGEVITARATIQTTADHYIRTGDYVFRGDGTRWQVKPGSEVSLQTGFHTTEPATTVMGYIFADIAREDESSPAFTIPPTVAEQKALLNIERVRSPADFSAVEEIRGPLI